MNDLIGKKFFWIFLIVVFYMPVESQEKACGITDPHGFQGAYRFADGRVVSIVPLSTQGQWRFTDFHSGKSHKLYATDKGGFQSADDWSSQTPVSFSYRFIFDKDGMAKSLAIKEKGKREAITQKIRFRERTATFNSGDTQLFGKLTLPLNGKAPFKTVVLVHGSDNEASVDRDWFPHAFAANGIATFVFDKRGTGCSGGQYTQHFGVLSDDVTAAVRWLKTRQEVDREGIGLAGYSQGGWVAPLAALKDPTVKFVLVGYGMAMPVSEEDRLEAPLKLKEKGFDKKSIEQFQELNKVLHTLARENFKDWKEFEKAIAKYKDTKWFAALKGSQTWAGSFLDMGLERAKIEAPKIFSTFFQPFYDPVPTLESLNIPILWMIAKEDIEAPPEPTIAILKRLRLQGKPFTTVIFPNTGHGILEFTIVNGRRVTTKYATDYFPTMVKWLKTQDPRVQGRNRH